MNFKINYKFIDQILDIYKVNIVVTLKKIMMPNFYQYIFKKYNILLISK